MGQVGKNIYVHIYIGIYLYFVLVINYISKSVICTEKLAKGMRQKARALNPFYSFGVFLDLKMYSAMFHEPLGDGGDRLLV